MLGSSLKVRLEVQDKEEEEESEDTSLVKGAGNKSGHERSKVSVGGHSIKPHVSDHANITSHKDLVGQGLGVSVHEEEDNGSKSNY